MSEPPRDRSAGSEHEPPPFLGTWSRLYALVLAALAVVIALLALLERGCR